MPNPMKTHRAFRPALAESVLEERVVLSALHNARIAVPPDARGVRMPTYALVLKAPATPFANSRLTARELRLMERHEVRFAELHPVQVTPNASTGFPADAVLPGY
jgi:hypothetical protein